MGITITEALAEIKTISKRIEKKRDFILTYLARQDGIKDPLEKEGGSLKAIERERQAINDLQTRAVTLRRGIQKANEVANVTLNGVTRTIADWLVWRRDVAPGHRELLNRLRSQINQVREQAKRNGATVLPSGGTAQNVTDVIVHINENDLATEIETLEDTLGQLDGQLSLKNATVPIVE